MNAGSTMTSRDSHEVRHISAARHARSGRPRWANDAPRPMSSIASANNSAPLTKPPAICSPVSCATASVTTSPCAAPAMVVNSTTDNAGFMASPSRWLDASVTRRGRYWLAGRVSHSGISG